VAVALLGPGVAAEAEPPPEGDWDFVVAPYIWLPAMTGSSSVNGRSIQIDTSVSDLFTKSDFVFSVSAELEAWYKQRFGFMLNALWSVIQQNDNVLGPADGPPFNLPGGGPGVFPAEFDLKSNIGLFEFAAAYRVGTWELGSGSSSPAFTLEPLVGVRVTTLWGTLDPKGNFSKVDQQKTWVDPILGARHGAPLRARAPLELQVPGRLRWLRCRLGLHLEPGRDVRL
jgi:hypothetical protein